MRNWPTKRDASAAVAALPQPASLPPPASTEAEHWLFLLEQILGRL